MNAHRYIRNTHLLHDGEGHKRHEMARNKYVHKEWNRKVLLNEFNY